ncbi:MAG: alpha/beta hydrolase [Actinomycetota bacterium]|nr:alpha/beta hydrolase [Actinomycetota bacterium]
MAAIAGQSISLNRVPGVRMLDEWRSTSRSSGWPDPPEGDGRPATLIPGFLAGDPSLTRMAKWLRGGEFSLVRSGIRWNVDCMEKTVAAVEMRLEQAVERDGRRALVVGQSRGGVIGKVLAIRRPDLIETLVTLGSPLRSQTAVHPHVWPSIGLVGGLGSAGVPGLLTTSCVDGDCCRQARGDLGLRFPGDVRFISFYSKNDSVVRYEACLDPAAEQIEIESSHLGMGIDTRVWKILAGELARSRA